MTAKIPKVQQKAIEEIQSKSLSSSDYRLLLHEAAEKGWAAVLDVAVLIGESRLVLLNRLLHSASMFSRDHPEAVRVLLKAGADPNAVNVMEFCGTETLPLLIKAGGDFDGEGKPLLISITERTKQDKALALIEVGADVNVADTDGVTALMHAAARGRNKVYDALVKAGADLYAVDHSGRSLARQIAESLSGGSHYSTPTDRKNATRIARQLQKMLPAQPEDQILLAIVLGDAKELKKMIDKGLDPETLITDGLGLTGFNLDDLMKRVKEYDNLIEALKAEDLIPTKQEQDAEMGGITLLMWATATEQPECIRVLLESGADPNFKNPGGISALTIAEKRVRYGTITQLLRSGINQGTKKKAGSLPRLQMLGLSEAEIDKQLYSAQEQFDYRKHDFPKENIGILIDRHWDITCLQFLLDEPKTCRKSLTSILKVADELFFGPHFKKPFRDSKAALPHTKQWKGAIDDWVECLAISLAASSATGKWQIVEKLLTYADEMCYRGEKSPRYNPEWYEWPLWLHIGALARQEKPKPTWLEEMKTKSTRRSKAVLSTYNAIVDQKAKAAQKAINRIIQAHIAEHKKWSKAVRPDRCISPEATYFYHQARKDSLDIDFQEDWQPYVLNFSD